MRHHTLPVPVGMNLTLGTQLLKILKNKGKKTLIMIHHDTETIQRVFKKLEDQSHHWWDVLFGWSPMVTGLLNALFHPIIVLLVRQRRTHILVKEFTNFVEKGGNESRVKKN